jgi:hypothetical protein
MGIATATIEMRAPEEHRERLHEIVGAATTVMVLSRGAGKPDAIDGRPMELVQTGDDTTMYVATSLDDEQAAQLERDPQVTVVVPGAGYALFTAEARISRDRQSRNAGGGDPDGDAGGAGVLPRGIDRQSQIAGGGDPDGDAGTAGGVPRCIDRRLLEDRSAGSGTRLRHDRSDPSRTIVVLSPIEGSYWEAGDRHSYVYRLLPPQEPPARDSGPA